jgi:hypothetical protein
MKDDSLFLFFTVALSLCVVGLIVIALAAILGSVRDDWKLKKPNHPKRGARCQIRKHAS